MITKMLIDIMFITVYIIINSYKYVNTLFSQFSFQIGEIHPLPEWVTITDTIVAECTTSDQGSNSVRRSSRQHKKIDYVNMNNGMDID